MRVLIIKISSMGDLIHTLPALTDAKYFIPELRVDWVVDPAFQEIPKWHPAVDNIILAPLRDWKNKWLSSFFKGEIIKFIKLLRKNKYYFIIDAQGLIKSSLIARLCRAKFYAGLDRHSARESVASIFYNKKVYVAKELHAIIRLRQLFAKTFNYSLNEQVLNYGVNWQDFPKKKADKAYLFFFHGTTWKTKHWPDLYWHRLAEIASSNGYAVYMTWATVEQKARVERLSKLVPGIMMLPHLSINEAAMYLRGANGMVAVDTGFAHLASAIGIPIVSLYGPTDPNKVGVFGDRQINLNEEFQCSPCLQKTCSYITKPGDNTIEPACFQKLTPEKVWSNLIKII